MIVVRKISSLTDSEIIEAYNLAMKRPNAVKGELRSPDSVRVACAWLSHQEQVQKSNKSRLPLKHMIESWAGFYVDQNSVTAAAILLGFKGEYPDFNISTNPSFPPIWALDGIESAFTHPHYLNALEGVHGYRAYGVGTKSMICDYIKRARERIADLGINKAAN